MIFQVDDVQLAGYTNQEAVEILKRTGMVVKLSIVRYLRGLKFEELQEGITQANVATPTSPYPQTPVTPYSSNDDILLSVDDRLNTSSQVTVSFCYLLKLNLIYTCFTVLIYGKDWYFTLCKLLLDVHIRKCINVVQ